MFMEDGRTVTAPLSKSGMGESLTGFDSSILRAKQALQA
jgi:hypothetical protein